MLSRLARRGVLMVLVLGVLGCQDPPRPEEPKRAAIPKPAPAKERVEKRYRRVSIREIAPGVEWTQYQGREKALPVFVNVVALDPRDARYQLKVVPAEGAGPTRRESTRQIARRHRAIAAINGSYFHFNHREDGRPIGLVKVEGEVLNPPRGDRPALGFALDGTAFFGHPRHLSAAEQKEKLAKTLLSKPEPMPRWRQWLRDLSGAPKPAKAAPEPPRVPYLNEPWDEAPFALEGGPLILQAGEIRLSDGFDAYIKNAREPRTAVGLTPEGRLLLVTVDGRVPGHSQGIALSELARLFLELGATEALNWDGGGSTTMMIGSELVSRVATGWCRPVSNALIIVERPPGPETP